MAPEQLAGALIRICPTGSYRPANTGRSLVEPNCRKAAVVTGSFTSNCDHPSGVAILPILAIESHQSSRQY